MTFEIGQFTVAPQVQAPVATRAPAQPHPADALTAPQGSPDVDTSDLIPATPPPEVLAEVDAAWERAAELAAQNRELHFARDEESGRMIIQVRTLDGEVLRTIPPSKALDVIGGGGI